jgi:hypothetical protein
VFEIIGAPKGTRTPVFAVKSDLASEAEILSDVAAAMIATPNGSSASSD